MSSTLSLYLPQDRRTALARGAPLPDRTTGAALFADISGFTPLTEALRDLLGPRRGAERLTRHLDAVYTALIAEVEKHGGSVKDFAGDSILCWFDDAHGPAAPRAAACAFALQQAMRGFAAIALPNGAAADLGLKVAVTTGPARRFVVGDPAIHYVDALVGATVARTATAEHLAQKGEVVLDEATLNALGSSALRSAVTVAEWRADAKSGERFAVAERRAAEAPALALPETEPAPAAEAAGLQAWVHRPVAERELSGQGSFLTEFRPCVALFVRFIGIDYESPEAEAQLDSFIRQVQAITALYEGTLLQLTIGDKGSYVYIVLGALSAHEDDARRAVKIALAVRAAAGRLGFLDPPQIGVAQGMMRVGTYGGPTRRTYGALGDDANVAARLMETAAPGEILASGLVQRAGGAQIAFEPRPTLLIKGKGEAVTVFAVAGVRHHHAIRLQEPSYELPMVGRQAEMRTIAEKLELALKGQAQVIGIVAEAGLGKSRLVAEVVRLARRTGFVGYGGACQSDAIGTPYQVWKSIWSAFFGVDPEMPLARQVRLLQTEIEDRVPRRVNALPLLGPLLNLAIPDNDFTKALEPKDRKGALHTLLEECLEAAAQYEPLLIVVEDMHWIDALSHSLLEELARAMTSAPICFILAYRPPQLARLVTPRLETLPNFTRIELAELSSAECELALRAKLAQLYPARSGALPAVVVETLVARAQGNPFYLEELLNFLRDRGLDPHHPGDLRKIELPDSLQSLVLSRIDQLSEEEKTTLRVASIIGRLFHLHWLVGYYPELGALPQVQAELDELGALDLTLLDSPEPERTYLFKHIVTHEVTYESLPFDTRARLHEQLAHFLEAHLADPAPAPLATIAHHYGLSRNQAKQREYWRKAGKAAQAAYANQAALDAYERLLPLLEDPRERIDLHLTRADLFSHGGQWAEAEAECGAALGLAAGDPEAEARCQQALGKLSGLRGEAGAALAWLEQARAGCAARGDQAGLSQALIEMGTVCLNTGEYADAQAHLEKGLALARAAGDRRAAAQSLNALGSVALEQGQNAAARELLEESLALKRELGDKWGIAASLDRLGILASNEGDPAAARALFEESLALCREMGSKRGVATMLNNLGLLASVQADHARAEALFAEGLALCREMDYRSGIVSLLGNLGFVAVEQGNYAAARHSFGESLRLASEISSKLYAAYNLVGLAGAAVEIGSERAVSRERAQHAVRLAAAAEAQLAAIQAVMEPLERRYYDRTLAAARAVLGEEAFRTAWSEGQALTLEGAIALALGPEPGAVG